MIGDAVTGSARNVAHDDQGTGSDEELVVLAQEDPAAFAALYLRYVDLVYRYCFRRLGDRSAAEDATSRIFERVLRALPKYRAGSFRSWLFTIAHNTITDVYRAERREKRAAVDMWTIHDNRPGPEEQSVGADDARWIRTLMDRLSDDQRQVVEFRLAGLTDIEIAAVLGRSHGSVRTIQYRAIRKLREILIKGSEDVHHTGVDFRGQD